MPPPFPAFRHPPTHRSSTGLPIYFKDESSTMIQQVVQEAIGAKLWSGVLRRRERAPTVLEDRSELGCTTCTDASPPLRLHTTSALRLPRRLDKRGPEGTG